MKINNKLENIILAIQKELIHSNGCHDWYHTERVLNLCLYLGKKSRANLQVLTLAALLHDIARPAEDKSKGRICHAKYGAKKAKLILKKAGFSKEIIIQVSHCIESHRFRNKKRPITKEAKILFDADKLDSIGAIGIGRAFVFAGSVGATVHIKNLNPRKAFPYSSEDTAYREFVVKLRYLKNQMLTEQGKKLARERHKFMLEFFKRLDREVEGKI